MKKLLTVILSLATITALSQTPTADEIIANYAKASGGTEAMGKLTSMKTTGAVSMMGRDLPLTIQVLYTKGVRIDVEVMGQSFTQVYANGKGWEINPFEGKNTPTEITGDAMVELKDQVSPIDRIIDYKNLGHKVELLGEETFEGVKVWNIKFTHKETGKDMNYFFSASDYMLIKTTGKTEMAGQQVEEQVVYSNYKEFGGIKFATSLDKSINGNPFQEVAFSNVELNVPIDEKIFSE